MAKECEFAQLTESLIQDRKVCGVNSDQIRARLLREPDLDLNKAIDICRASEVTKSLTKAAEVFQKCIAQRLEDLEGVVNIMDDILVWLRKCGTA